MSLLLALTGASGGAFTLNADSGSYAISGTAATLLKNSIVDAAPGAYLIAGTDATLLRNKVLPGDSGAYLINGTDATFVYTPVGAYTLNADSGAYSISGTDAAFVYTPASDQVWGGHWQPYWLDKREWEKKIPQKAVQAIERVAQSEKRGIEAEKALRDEIADFQTRYLDMLRGMQAMQVNTLQALRLMQMREIARIEQEIEDENNEFLLLM